MVANVRVNYQNFPFNLTFALHSVNATLGGQIWVDITITTNMPVSCKYGEQNNITNFSYCSQFHLHILTHKFPSFLLHSPLLSENL